MLLACFDLDYTIWAPEMYQIQGPPQLVTLEEFQGKKRGRKGNAPPLQPSQVPKESTTIDPNKIVMDRQGTPMTVFAGASHALAEINRMKQEGSPILAAISSRTDEPAWARQIMKWLVANDGKPLADCFDHVEIGYQDKALHFESLHRKTGIPFDSMVFFDNEHWNIESVSKLGVKCIYTPHGMSKEAWNEALEHFDMI
jgi:magnesium-dependent phosphatase 1